MDEYTPQGIIEAECKHCPLRIEPDPVFDFAIKASLYSELYFNSFLIPKTIFAQMKNGETKGGE